MVLPSIVKHAFGLVDSGGEFEGQHSTTSLADMNDIDRCTFAEIAAVIESRPPGLFIEEEPNGYQRKMA